jgi:hypothetical protein
MAHAAGIRASCLNRWQVLEMSADVIAAIPQDRARATGRSCRRG